MREERQATVTQMNNAYTERHADDMAKRHHQNLIRARHRRHVLAILFAFTVICIGFSVQIVHTKASMNTLQTKVIKTKQQLKKANSEKNGLKIQVKQLKDDDYLQKLIRNKYYFSKAGETIYSIPLDKAPNLSKK